MPWGWAWGCTMISHVLAFQRLQAASGRRFDVYGVANAQSNSICSSRTKLIMRAPIMSANKTKSATAMPSSKTESFEHGQTRRSRNFAPSMWSPDQFLTKRDDHIIDPSTQQKHEELKEEVRRMLLMEMARSSQLQDKLKLIASIQRLGVAYHFESEIQEILQHVNYTDDGAITDLYSSALLFRLMREFGFKISPDIFKKFQDDGGNFLDSLKFDLQGMLALYEASYMSCHGEDILHQAHRFSITCLQLALTSQTISPLEQQVVTEVINWPLYKNCARFEAIHYLPLYSRDMSHNETLLKFATLDFNIVQAMHKMELNELCMWWNDLDLLKKLPYVRDRVVEMMFWMMVVFFEPQYSLARVLGTKLNMIISIIDDTYDIYGTVEELELLTNAIERLDIDSINALPEYMKPIMHALLDLYSEVEEKTKGRPYVIHYVKQEFKRMTRAYLVDAKWINEEYLPTVEEYMNVALITAGSSFWPATMLAGVEDVTDDAFQWACSDPKLAKASATITRLLDDMFCDEFERVHPSNAVNCYMKNLNVTEEEAKAILENQIENAWKDINEELIILGQNSSLPKPVIMSIVNTAKATDIFNRNCRDAYSNPNHLTQGIISSLLVDPMSI